MVFNAVRKHKWSKMLAKNKLWNILWICLENSNIKKKKEKKTIQIPESETHK